jgi:hypothetical protein
MKISLLVAVIIIAAATLLVGFGRKSKANTIANNSGNPYKELRDKALHITPQELELELPASKTVVYGVVMDWSMGADIVTLVSFQTGDVSMYFSNGGGMIGGGQHANVNSAAKTFIQKSQSYISKAKLTTETPLPGDGGICFYLLTNKGIYTAQEKLKNVQKAGSEWNSFFTEANVVISEFRIATEK